MTTVRRAAFHVVPTETSVTVCLTFGLNAAAGDVVRAAKVASPEFLRAYPDEGAAADTTNVGVPLLDFVGALKEGPGLYERLTAAGYTVTQDGELNVTVDRDGATKDKPRARRHRSKASDTSVLWEAIRMVWPRDSRDVYLPARKGPSCAPPWVPKLAARVAVAIAKKRSIDVDMETFKRWDKAGTVAKMIRARRAAHDHDLSDGAFGGAVLEEEERYARQYQKGPYGRLWKKGARGDPGRVFVPKIR